MDKSKVLDIFHPIVKEWFLNHIGTPSLPQVEGWPQIQSGKNVLISAPTGAGKTLAAFLESINRLLEMGIRRELPEGVFILYVSPLKALNNDINRNLEVPFQGIRRMFAESGEAFPDIRKAVRTGDTTQHQRNQILKNPPHILITTPESLFLMLTSVKSREILKNVHYLIVDEIHTLLGTKRGVHLALSMERLEALAGRKITRIGLSATVNPLDSAAKFLGGYARTGDGCIERPVEIIAPAMERNKELKILVPVKDYRVLEQGSVWPDVYDSILKLIQQNLSTIVFVNNRATAEKVAANVNSLAGEEICCPHHGSISKSRRLDVEERFKSGDLRCIIATSTLELGIDVGSVDFIAQVAAPPSVSGGLQRLGRAGHKLSATSRGVIIPKTRGDLLKAFFIAGEMLEGRIEKERIPANCLDILAQHIVSMCCTEKWTEEELFGLVRQAYSYKTLREGEFKKVLMMLSGDYEHSEDIPVKPRIMWDRVNKILEGTTYSRMLAVSSAGTIPDRGTFTACLEDCKTRIGELDEEFVFESRLGDRFMLGNSPWKIVRIERNRVIVSPCSVSGAKPPFWKGDGIGMPFEQAISFGRFVGELAAQAESGTFMQNAVESGIFDETGALNVRNYLTDQMEAVGTLASDRRVVIEHTSSNENDNKIVIHAHFGGRVNSVLAILIQHALDTKIRCKAHTSYTNDAVLIHFYGFPDELHDIFSLISYKNVEQVLIGTLPKTSRFALTFRYNAYRALMMGIRKHGQRLPLWVQRLRSVDALENAQKTIDHPLIIETMRECLEDIFDIPNTVSVLRDIEQGRIQTVEKRTWFSSPFAAEILFQFEQEFLYMEKKPHPGDNEYPSISGAETLNLSYRNGKRTAAGPRDDAVKEIIKNTNTMYKLSQVNSANELHSFLLIYGDVGEGAFSDRQLEWLHELEWERRVIRIPSGQPCDNDVRVHEQSQQAGREKAIPTAKSVNNEPGKGYLLSDIENINEASGENPGEPILESRYIAAEEASLYYSAEDAGHFPSNIHCIDGGADTWTRDDAIARILRRFARYNSPFEKTLITARYSFNGRELEKALSRLQAEGYLIYDEEQNRYYHNTIYDRAVRLSLNMAAGEVTARDSSAFACLLAQRHKLGTEDASGDEGLYDAVIQLEGLYLPAAVWESIVFPARIKGYSKKMLDRLCGAGRISWRILPGDSGKEMKLAWFKTESISYDEDIRQNPGLSGDESMVFQTLKQKGATFTHALSSVCGIPTSGLLTILKSLVMKGMVVNDSFQPLRYFMEEDALEVRDPVQKAKRIALMISKMEMGRWELAYPPKKLAIQDFITRCGRRYGLLAKEINELEQSPYTWSEMYEALKQMEYVGDIGRGYYFKGISGIQFMFPGALKNLDAEKQDFIVLNACDPAQPYGRIIPHTEHRLPFICVPGTVIVLYMGMPVLLLERYGEKIACDPDFKEIGASADALRRAFQGKRIWPESKKLVVKYWPEDTSQKSLLQSVLTQAGFMPEIDRMVLWRQTP